MGSTTTSRAATHSPLRSTLRIMLAAPRRCSIVAVSFVANRLPRWPPSKGFTALRLPTEAAFHLKNGDLICRGLLGGRTALSGEGRPFQSGANLLG